MAIEPSRPNRRLTTPTIGLIALAVLLVLFAVIRSHGPKDEGEGVPAGVKQLVGSLKFDEGTVVAPVTWVKVTGNSVWSDDLKQQVQDRDNLDYVVQTPIRTEDGDTSHLVWPVRTAQSGEGSDIFQFEMGSLDLSGLGEVHTINQEDLDSLD
ncbi:hypothetical protein [Kineosporia mesophila]|uniref:hypothetical protein n=1 Tax=Kineosporia mesophila TaxID=566012 RepID=UPI001E2B2372|nr:hypothetical protein [Kineosporia mesophila]MCD5353462.1 hypothetical protein [Kineosporia mesophila]